MASYNDSEPIILDLSSPPFAIITLNIPQKKNAMDILLYKKLSSILQVSAVVKSWQAKSRDAKVRQRRQLARIDVLQLSTPILAQWMILYRSVLAGVPPRPLQAFSALTLHPQSVDRRPEIKVTLLTGRGDFFSAGADVKAVREGYDATNEDDARTASLRRLGESNLDLTRALYRHSKILVAGLNGPAVGEYRSRCYLGM